MSSVDKDRQLVVKLLNDAKLETNREAKITKLRQVEEILIHKHPDTLLPEFLQNVLEFHLENTPYVRKFLAGFVESVCKKNASCKLQNCKPNTYLQLDIQQCAETLLYLSNDASANVIKKVCSAATAVYAKALQLMYVLVQHFSIKGIFLTRVFLFIDVKKKSLQVNWQRFGEY